MIYFTADMHFHHDKIIRHSGRPFRSTDEMDKALIRNWNDRIAPDDEIYILGDVTMKGAGAAQACLSLLSGKKHLIRGNHDSFLDRQDFQLPLFASVSDYAEIVYRNTCFVLCHYPILEWNGYRKGAIMLHGHRHNHEDYNIRNRRDGILRYDVGVDANNMAPVSAETIISFFS